MYYYQRLKDLREDKDLNQAAIATLSFNVTADLLDKACGYYKEETEIRHDPTDHSE